jgi:hypothetical protein
LLPNILLLKETFTLRTAADIKSVHHLQINSGELDTGLVQTAVVLPDPQTPGNILPAELPLASLTYSRSWRLLGTSMV